MNACHEPRCARSPDPLLVRQPQSDVMSHMLISE